MNYMNVLEKIYLDRALRYKDLHEKTIWWRFDLKRHYKRELNHALDMMIEYSEPIKQKRNPKSLNRVGTI